MPVSEKKHTWIVPVSLAGLSFLFFQFFYPYHLFFKEQIQLFLYTADYFQAYFNKPAWLASYTGDFLTQFLYLRGGGPAVISLILVIEWWISSKVIRQISFTTKATLWALIPVGMDWILHLGILHGISVSMGYIAVLVLFLIYSKISNRWLSLAAGLVIIPIAYWIAGMGVLLLPVLIMARDWNQGSVNGLKWIAISALAGLIPPALRHTYLLTPLQSFIYPALQVKSLILPIAFIFILAVVSFLKKFEITYSKGMNWAVPIASMGVLAGGIAMNANFHLEKILSLDSETYFGNTERVIELSQKYQLKDWRASYFTNMALSKKGMLPEYLLDYYQPAFHGLILPVMPDENWQSIFVSNEVFYLVGDMNLAQHSAMLGNTFSPFQRSSRMIKRLAEINMVNGDGAAAGKYLHLLKNTLFHKKWAVNRQPLNHTSASVPWLAEKRKQIPHADTLRKSNDYVPSLCFLVEQNPDNVIAVDYLLCYYLLNKDLNSFVKAYELYGRGISRPVPSLYSEALLIHLFSVKASAEKTATYSINPQKIKDFIAYTQLYGQKQGEMKAMEERYGKSYWFYYHFATIKNP